MAAHHFRAGSRGRADHKPSAAAVTADDPAAGSGLPAAGGNEPAAGESEPGAAGGSEPGAGAVPPVLQRRSARSSRRAVLFLHDLDDEFTPSEVARWYADRGFDFYVAALGARPPAGETAPGRPRPARRPRPAGPETACRYLRETAGIRAIVLTAHGSAAAAAVRWCTGRGAEGGVDALILSSPELGRLPRGIDIGCPVLVIDGDGTGQAPGRRRPADAWRLGPHVTVLRLEADLGGQPAGEASIRLFDEMGRWLGAYMYGKPRDQLL